MITFKEKFSDKKALYECLGNFMKIAKKPQPVNLPAKVGGGSYIPSVSSPSSLVWDPSKSGGGIAIT